MSILKNEIPILEFDTEQTAVINPTHEKLDLKLPKKCVFAFLGDYIDEYACKTETWKVSEFVSSRKLYPIYITKYKGEEIVLCQAPVGAAPATQIICLEVAKYCVEHNMQYEFLSRTEPIVAMLDGTKYEITKRFVKHYQVNLWVLRCTKIYE